MATEDPDVAPPPVAAEVESWETHDGKTLRFFRGGLRGGAAQVEITGFQDADGSVHGLAIHVDANEPLEAEAAQELIDNLTAARADVLRLNVSAE